MAEKSQINPPGYFSIKETTDAEFDRDVLKKTNPVYVLFYSHMCSLCKEMEETINKVGIAFNGRLEFYKVNIHNNPAYSAKYAATAMPCSVIFSKGEIIRDTRIMDGQSVWSGNAVNLQYYLNWVNTVLNVANERY